MKTSFYADPAEEPPGLTREGKAHLTYPHEPCALYSVRGAKFIHDAFASAPGAQATTATATTTTKKKKKKTKEEEKDKDHRKKKSSPAMQAFQQSLDAKVMNFNDGSMVDPVEDSSWRGPGTIFTQQAPRFAARKNGMFRSSLPKVGSIPPSTPPCNRNINRAKETAATTTSSFTPTCDRNSLLYKYEKQVYLNTTTKAVRKARRRRPKSALANSRRRKVQPPDGGLSLFVAAQRADFARIRHLLHSGHSRASDKNAYHMTALHYVVEASGKRKADLSFQGDCVRIAALLLQWGGNMHAENQVGASPVSLASIVSPIMSALFKRYLQKQRDAGDGDEKREFPLDTRTPGQVIRDEQRLLRNQGRQKKKLMQSRAKNREDFARGLHQWRNDFATMEKRNPRLLRGPQRTGAGKGEKKGARPITASAAKKETMATKPMNKKKTTTRKMKKKDHPRWWSSVDVHLRNAKWAATSSDKVLQWQRELDRRRALDKLKPQVLHDYIGDGAVREQSVRKSRLMRYAKAKRLDRIRLRQEAVARYENHLLDRQRHTMAPHDLRQAARRRQRTIERARLTEFDRGANLAPPLTEALDSGASLTAPLGKPPVGFFTLDSEGDIKEAFKVLSGGQRTIELPVLLHWLQTVGDPPLEDAEVDRLRDRIGPFAMAAHGGQGAVGSLRIDYERFVDAMVWLSRREDAKDLAEKAMQLNKGASYY
jgi:hypothetical protein